MEFKTAPVLVLGLGNSLLMDDGLGLRVLESLQALEPRWDGRVEFVDGGTQGIALLGRLEGRRAVLFLDAIFLGAPPGTIHRLGAEQLLGELPGMATSVHGGNVGDLVRAAALIGGLPGKLAAVGVEPGRVATGVGLSSTAENALPGAARVASDLLDSWVTEFR
jgi:hydrogenase maturation protease